MRTESVTTPPRVLHYGTRDGIFLRFSKLKGIGAGGFELSRKAAAFGRRKPDVEIFDVPLENPQDSEGFDIVTLFNVFDYLTDPGTALAKIAEITKQNAIVALEVPNVFTPQALLFRGRWHHFENEHHWFFNRDTMRMLLSRHGFSVVKAVFVPKIVTLARPVWELGWVLGVIEVFEGLHQRMRTRERIYGYLDKKRVRINNGDYLCDIARKVGT